MSILSMTKTLFKSIFHGPYTTQYPLAKKENFDRTRGKIEITIEDCIFCSQCQRRCPTGALTVDRAKSLWAIDRLKCIQCNYCTEVCPKKCLRMDNQYTAPSYEGVREEFIKENPVKENPVKEKPENARVSDNKENN